MWSNCVSQMKEWKLFSATVELAVTPLFLTSASISFATDDLCTQAVKFMRKQDE